MFPLESVDGDGDPVVHLETDDLTLEPGAVDCTIGALTYLAGFVVAGTDTVYIVAPQ